MKFIYTSTRQSQIGTKFFGQQPVELAQNALKTQHSASKIMTSALNNGLWKFVYRLSWERPDNQNLRGPIGMFGGGNYEKTASYEKVFFRKTRHGVWGR